MQRNYMIRILAVLLMSALVLCAGCAKTTPPKNSAAPEASAGLSDPVNEDMQIETPYCTLTIPFAFSDLVSVEHSASDAADSYVFSANLADRSVQVYAINFVKGEDAMPGELFGTIQTKDGGVQVTYAANEPDETL